eukprot:gene24765-10407_t
MEDKTVGAETAATEEIAAVAVAVAAIAEALQGKAMSSTFRATYSGIVRVRSRKDLKGSDPADFALYPHY